MFEINKAIPIILYGFSPRGIPVYNQMKAAGYNVKGFFDRNAAKLCKKEQVNIWSVEENRITDKEAVVVIICFENAIEQNKVAGFLFQKGFKKIVYLPMGVNYNQDIAMRMRKIYNFILDGNYDQLEDIPEYEEMQIQCNALDIVKKENGCYTVWIPIEYVYTDNVIRIPYAQKKQKNKDFIKFVHEFMDIPLCMNHMYLSLYRYFLGKSELDENYFRFQDLEDNREDFEDYREHLLKDRYHLFHIYDQEFNRGSAFFVDSAPKAVWNENGYFNLTDGHHRSIFLYIMGYTSLPLVVTEDDYSLYRGFIKKGEMNMIHMNDSRDYLVKIMPEIFEALWEFHPQDYWVQDFGQYNGYFKALIKKIRVLNYKKCFIAQDKKGIIFLMEKPADGEQLKWLSCLHGGLMVLGIKENEEVQLIERKTGWKVIKKIGSFFNGEDMIVVSLCVK